MYNGIELQFLNRTATYETHAIARYQCKLICIRVYFYSNSPSVLVFMSNTLVNAVNYCVFCTVAEKDTAAAAKAAMGRPKAAVGRPSAAAGRRGSAAPAKTFENRFSSLQLVN